MHPGLIAALYLAGVALLVLELFTPGLVAGICGLGALGGAVYLLFDGYGAIAGGLGLAGATGLTIGVAIVGARRLTSSHRQDPAAYTVADPSLDALAGAEGVAVSPLRPAGVVRFDGALSGRRVDVVTRGDMIAAGARVRVVAIDGNRVVVEQA